MSREADNTRKQERSSINNDSNTSKASSSTSTWSRFKDPRVVPVSKAFGGKDRHSKVRTVRGLRDRRVRLSVQTAIQLYDLQERLGFSQPSKVVDWLLHAAEHEIDELPPLQIPQGISFTQTGLINPILTSQMFTPSQSDKHSLKINGCDSIPKLQHLRSSTTSGETRSEEERQLNLEILSRQHQHPSSFSSLMSSATAPFNSWDPSNLTLSHPPISLGLNAQHYDSHSFSLVQLPGINSQPYFLPQISSTTTEFDLKQPNFHTSELSNASTQPVRPLRFSMTADLLPSQNELHSS